LSDGRTETFSQTDLNVQHAIKLGGEKQIVLSLKRPEPVRPEGCDLQVPVAAGIGSGD
jgi:hypothetical protein